MAVSRWQVDKLYAEGATTRVYLTQNVFANLSKYERQVSPGWHSLFDLLNNEKDAGKDTFQVRAPAEL